MNLLGLLFIYALEGGITGNLQNDIDPYYHVEAEAGIRLENVLLTGVYYFEPVLYENTANNQHYKIKLTVDTDNFDFGFNYDYNVSEDADLFTIWGRYESEGFSGGNK